MVRVVRFSGNRGELSIRMGATTMKPSTTAVATHGRWAEGVAAGMGCSLAACWWNVGYTSLTDHPCARLGRVLRSPTRPSLSPTHSFPPRSPLPALRAIQQPPSAFAAGGPRRSFAVCELEQRREWAKRNRRPQKRVLFLPARSAEPLTPARSQSRRRASATPYCSFVSAADSRKSRSRIVYAGFVVVDDAHDLHRMINTEDRQIWRKREEGRYVRCRLRSSALG
jgi:hypothetical protein